MSAGGEAENKNARIRVAEAGNRFAPIFVLAVRASFFSSDEFAVRDEAGTACAGNNFAIELNKPIRTAGHNAIVRVSCPYLFKECARLEWWESHEDSSLNERF